MIKHRLLVAVFASMALTGWSGDTEIIVESAPDGLNHQAFSTEGRWSDSAGKSTAPGVKGTTSKFNDANDEAGSARFTPDIPTAGQYEVFMTYPVQGNAEGVKYKVVSSDGEKELVLTQYGRQDGNDPTANEWYSLGTYNFAAGKSGYVEVSDPLTGVKPHAADNGRVYADAFKFVPVGISLPADYVNQPGTGAPAVPAVATPVVVAAAATPAAQTSASSLPGLPDASKPAPTGLPALPDTAPAAGLPALPATPAPSAGLPALPPSTGAAAALPGLPGNAASNLPSLAPVAPTPRHNIPTPSDTPAPVAPGLSASNLPSLPTGPAPMGQTLPIGIPPTIVQPAAPGSVPGAPTVTPATGPSISQYNPSGLQWMFDYGAGLKSARDQNKKVMVFLTAYGNTSAEKYENEYFQHPAVRQALDNYVLVKIDFPRNTRLGYSLGVFGAGTIVVVDATGSVTARVEQLPSTPADLVRLMAATRPTRAAVTAAQADQASSGTAEVAAPEVPAAPAVPPAPAAPGDAAAAMPAMPELPTAPAAPAVPPAPAAPGAPPVPTPPAM